MNNVFGIVFANYNATGFGELLHRRTIASLPFAGRYRLIDFALSNMVNSGIGTVGLIMPTNYRSLIDHVGSGKEWSLSKKIGGLFILPGTVFSGSSNTQKFMLSDLLVNHRYIERRADDTYAVISSASNVCSLDYTEMIEQHMESGKTVTFAYFKDENGAEKPLDCFVVSRATLLGIIESYPKSSHLDLVELLEREYGADSTGRYVFDAYVRPIETIEDYIKANQDLLDPQLHKQLFRGERAVFTKVQDEAPTIYNDGCEVKNSLIPAGCNISGKVENCVLARSVVVEEGASLKNCIVFQHGIIKRGTVVENAILDKYVTISSSVRLCGGTERPLIIGKNLTL